MAIVSQFEGWPIGLMVTVATEANGVKVRARGRGGAVKGEGKGIP